MLNILPRVTGLLVARHLKISYTAAADLAYIAFWNGLKLRLETTSPVRTAGARALTLRDGEARKSFSNLRDTREVLDKVRTTVENYRRPRRPWWAVVPADQYSFTKFL